MAQRTVTIMVDFQKTNFMMTPEEEAVQQINDARKALQLTREMFKTDLARWQQEGSAILTDVRQWRMATDAELRKTLEGFNDVRKFFLSDDHPTQVQRLREFVELCERLQKLKESGFLDQVADTILKLEKV